MKKPIVSIKSSGESLSSFKNALTAARKGRLRGEHLELAFSKKKDFDRFVRNLGILSAILNYKPKSIYELAKHLDMDVSNLTKLISFFESLGAIRVKTSTVAGRTVKTPLVEYDLIEFDLKVN